MGGVSIAEFEREVERFLARYPLRGDRGATFTWGVGSDAVDIFEETDQGEDARRLVEVRRWRAEMDAAGLAWISGPVEYDGRALSRDHQGAFDRLSRQREAPGSGPLTSASG